LFANEIAAFVAGRPGLPGHVLRPKPVTDVDVRFRHQHIDSRDRGRWRELRRRRLLRSTRQQGGNAARRQGDGQDDKTRGFHTLTLYPRPFEPHQTHGGAAATYTRFDQLKVKVWLSSGIQIELMV